MQGPGQPQARAVSSRESPTQLLSGGAGVTVQLVPRGPPLPSYVVGSSGKIREVVMWKEKCAPELVPELCPTTGDVGRAGPTWGGKSCPGSTPGRRGSCALEQPPKPWSVSLPCPPISTTNPGSYSYSQPSSRAVGSWAGPVGRAGLTIAARDSRRAFGTVGLYVWRDLGSC